VYLIVGDIDIPERDIPLPTKSLGAISRSTEKSEYIRPLFAPLGKQTLRAAGLDVPRRMPTHTSQNQATLQAAGGTPAAIQNENHVSSESLKELPSTANPIGAYRLTRIQNHFSLDYYSELTSRSIRRRLSLSFV